NGPAGVGCIFSRGNGIINRALPRTANVRAHVPAVAVTIVLGVTTQDIVSQAVVAGQQLTAVASFVAATVNGTVAYTGDGLATVVEAAVAQRDITIVVVD